MCPSRCKSPPIHHMVALETKGVTRHSRSCCHLPDDDWQQDREWKKKVLIKKELIKKVIQSLKSDFWSYMSCWKHSGKDVGLVCQSSRFYVYLSLSTHLKFSTLEVLFYFARCENVMLFYFCEWVSVVRRKQNCLIIVKHFNYFLTTQPLKYLFPVRICWHEQQI